MHNKIILITFLFWSSFYFCQEASDSNQVPQEKVISEKDSLSNIPLNQLGIMHLQSVYDSNLPTMGMTSLQYLRKTKNNKATFIGRVNYRFRNGNNSLKYDFESYLKHGKKHYSFFGASVSDKKMFPGFEAHYYLYSALKKGWELETGAKFLSATNFSLFTPVIGMSKEFGNNRITLRNFFTFAENDQYYGNSLTWRYFLNDSRDNISLMTGFGNAPDSKNIDFSEDFISNKSKFLGVGFEKKLKSFKLSAAGVYNNNNYSTGRKFNQFDIYMNIFYDF
ncbi:MAG: YaiO family outer membrane beta-barrel protein [Cloacibacterium sp.]|nr:YaiO family outer membrane beta-barrel protein [Cloacibacterium sp.]